MSWVDIENAMHFAVSQASGFPLDRVVWSFQNYNSQPQDYVLIHFGGERQIGQDWIKTTTNLSRPLGQEIKMQVRGVREVPFEIQVFTSDTLGDSAARRVAELIRSRFNFDSIRYRLRRAGVGVFDLGAVSYVPDIPDSRFRGRATCTIRCYVPVIDCIEYTTYIQSVRGTIYPVSWYGQSGASGIPFDTDG